MEIRGVVSYYDDERGFGFVSAKEFERDLYFSSRILKTDSVSTGTPVEVKRHNIHMDGHPKPKIERMKVRSS